MDSQLSEALSLGRDFVGRLTFEELKAAIDSRRFRVLSIFRTPDHLYEVVLQAVN